MNNINDITIGHVTSIVYDPYSFTPRIGLEVNLEAIQQMQTLHGDVGVTESLDLLYSQFKTSIMNSIHPKKQMNKCVVSCSGGMDSVVLLHYAVKNFNKVYCVSFGYGQRHSKELQFAELNAKKLCAEYKHLDISFVKDIITGSALLDKAIDVPKARDVMGDPQTRSYVPFRNMMLLSICCAYAESVEADTVLYGAAQADSVAGFYDGSKEFLEKMNDVTILNRRNKIKIEAPLINMSKADIIKMGDSLGVNFAETWTCYEGGDKACGVCTACSLRLSGFMQTSKELGITDPIPYAKQISWKKIG